MQILNHYVYFLFVRRKLVYVGRSLRPHKRQRVFEKLTGLKTFMHVSLMPSLEVAQDIERACIREARPPYNKIVQSGRSSFGMKLRPRTHDEKARLRVIATAQFATPEARQRASEIAVARLADPTTRQRMREGALRKFEDPAQRKKIGDIVRGRRHTPATKAYIAECSRRTHADPEISLRRKASMAAAWLRRKAKWGPSGKPSGVRR